MNNFEASKYVARRSWTAQDRGPKIGDALLLSFTIWKSESEFFRSKNACKRFARFSPRQISLAFFAVRPSNLQNFQKNCKKSKI